MPGTTHCYAAIIVWNGNPLPPPPIPDLLNLILYRSSNVAERQASTRGLERCKSDPRRRDRLFDRIFQIPFRIYPSPPPPSSNLFF